MPRSGRTHGHIGHVATRNGRGTKAWRKLGFSTTTRRLGTHQGESAIPRMTHRLGKMKTRATSPPRRTGLGDQQRRPTGPDAREELRPPRLAPRKNPWFFPDHKAAERFQRISKDEVDDNDLAGRFPKIRRYRQTSPPSRIPRPASLSTGMPLGRHPTRRACRSTRFPLEPDRGTLQGNQRNNRDMTQAAPDGPQDPQAPVTPSMLSLSKSA